MRRSTYHESMYTLSCSRSFITMALISSKICLVSAWLIERARSELRVIDDIRLIESTFGFRKGSFS